MDDQTTSVRSPRHSHDLGSNDDPPVDADALLLVIAGGPVNTTLCLHQPRTVIGAQHDATIRLTDWHAPKVAATITRHGAQYVLMPAGSGKRVRLNGALVPRPVQLTPGDRIDLCGLVVEFVRSIQRKAA